MSVLEMNHSNAVGGFGFGPVVARLTAWVSASIEARQTRRELSRLSDRELADIGLARGDIERVARGL